MNIEWSSFHTPYNESEVKKYVPTSAGVYLLWVKYKSDRWEAFYIGQASNLENRLLEHLSDEEKNNCIKENVKYTSGFHYAKVGKQSDRDGIEKYLYDHYSTECNKVDPGGTSILVNLPSTPTS
ncbi:GIY-YIG nuclease family protein [candidate division KSB1 bacterium]|nr:GIY-YIG nuclease family protein [candidate division KSB1 bacterium]